MYISLSLSLFSLYLYSLYILFYASNIEVKEPKIRQFPDKGHGNNFQLCPLQLHVHVNFFNTKELFFVYNCLTYTGRKLGHLSTCELTKNKKIEVVDWMTYNVDSPMGGGGGGGARFHFR